MSGTPTTFNGDILTNTSFQDTATQDGHFASLVSAATRLPHITTTEFLASQNPSFYQSTYYQQTITNNNPPPDSSYAKDPNGLQDDNSIGDASMNYANLAMLGSGQAQTVLHGDQSILVGDQNAYLTVQGNLSVGYGGLRTETIKGKLNQKIYNGEKSIYNAPSIRFFDQLVTTYEHKDVSVQSFADDTILHFGTRNIFRAGNEVDLNYGSTTATTFGTETTNLYGGLTEIINGSRTVKMDHVLNVQNTVGLFLGLKLGLGLASLVGTESFINLFSISASIYENLIGLVKGKIQAVTLKNACVKLEQAGVSGKALGLCLRAVSLVFGVVRA